MSLPQYLFNRAWSISIGKRGEAGKLYSSVAQRGVAASPLRIVFDIEKSSISTPNKGKIEVYNLNAQSRLNYQKGYQIQLQAGYEGLLSTLYIGDIPQGPKGAITHRKAEDVITVFECGDSEKQLIYSFFDKSYPPGTRISQIFEDLANALGVDLGIVLGIKQQVYNTGYVASGSIKRNLDLLTKKQGLDWSVQNGYLQILPKGKHNGDTAIVLSNQVGPSQPGLTGLIGTPSQGDGFITFEALLNPHLLPDCPVQIVSENISGFFKIRKTHFQGDTHGNKWTATCEATSIAAVQNLPNQNLNGKFVVVA